VFFFGTITGLDTQVEVLISLMKPAFPIYDARLLLLYALVRQTIEEVA
jgi:hypothetical protein